jgi:hypothetical protein
MPAMCLPASAGSWASNNRRLHGAMLPTRPLYHHNYFVMIMRSFSVLNLLKRITGIYAGNVLARQCGQLG